MMAWLQRQDPSVSGEDTQILAGLVDSRNHAKLVLLTNCQETWKGPLPKGTYHHCELQEGVAGQLLPEERQNHFLCPFAKSGHMQSVSPAALKHPEKEAPSLQTEY